MDPDTFSYYLAADLLKEYNIDIIHVKSGSEAIQLFEENPFMEVVITEIIVPIIDGFEILKAIRKINPHIYVIVQTAYVHDNMQQKCRAAGFNDYIAKPIDIKRFIFIIERSILFSRQR